MRLSQLYAEELASARKYLRDAGAAKAGYERQRLRGLAITHDFYATAVAHCIATWTDLELSTFEVEAYESGLGKRDWASHNYLYIGLDRVKRWNGSNNNFEPAHHGDSLLL